MKKLTLATTLLTAAFLLTGTIVHAKKNTKKGTGPSKYWTFLQGLEKGISEKKTDELKAIIDTLDDLTKARTEFEKTCGKNEDPRCRELLESYLKIEISTVEEIKKDIFETGVDLKTAIRNLASI